MQRSRRVVLGVAFSLVFLAAPAGARTTFHDLSVREAKGSQVGQEKLLDVPFYMKGERHPRVVEKKGSFTSNRRTNAFSKSDQDACRIAFLSAIIALQRRAQSMGANGVIDIRSITRNNDLESATQYRCAAGNVIANVALTGTIVKFAR